MMSVSLTMRSVYAWGYQRDWVDGSGWFQHRQQLLLCATVHHWIWQPTHNELCLPKTTVRCTNIVYWLCCSYKPYANCRISENASVLLDSFHFALAFGGSASCYLLILFVEQGACWACFDIKDIRFFLGRSYFHQNHVHKAGLFSSWRVALNMWPPLNPDVRIKECLHPAKDFFLCPRKSEREVNSHWAGAWIMVIASGTLGPEQWAHYFPQNP